jgi:cytochrome c-type biogenesis protein CcmH/NrfG
LPDAESHARRAVELAGDKGGPARFLLAEIQFAQGKTLDARKTWRKLVDELPSDPSTPAAKRKLEATSGASRKAPESSNVPLPNVLSDNALSV